MIGSGAEMVDEQDMTVSDRVLGILTGKRCFWLMDWPELLRLDVLRLELSKAEVAGLGSAGTKFHDDITFESDTSERDLVALNDLPSEPKDTVDSLFAGVDHRDGVRECRLGFRGERFNTAGGVVFWLGNNEYVTFGVTGLGELGGSATIKGQVHENDASVAATPDSASWQPRKYCSFGRVSSGDGIKAG